MPKKGRPVTIGGVGTLSAVLLPASVVLAVVFAVLIAMGA